jgi:membrane-associated phospholipid phosphatase
MHLPSDVLGGIFVAMFWVNAILAVYSFLNPKKRVDA